MSKFVSYWIDDRGGMKLLNLQVVAKVEVSWRALNDRELSENRFWDPEERKVRVCEVELTLTTGEKIPLEGESAIEIYRTLVGHDPVEPT